MGEGSGHIKDMTEVSLLEDLFLYGMNAVALLVRASLPMVPGEPSCCENGGEPPAVGSSSKEQRDRAF